MIHRCGNLVRIKRNCCTAVSLDTYTDVNGGDNKCARKIRQLGTEAESERGVVRDGRAQGVTEVVVRCESSVGGIEVSELTLVRAIQGAAQ